MVSAFRRPADLGGIEMYNGPSITPIEFDGPGNLRGAIALWTRVRPRNR